MADVRAFRSGNWSDTTATSPWWNGTAIFAPAAGDVVYTSNFTITADTTATVNAVLNASATSRVWKDGGLAAVAAGGNVALATGIVLTANGSGFQSANGTLLTLSGTASAEIVGNLTAHASGAGVGVLHSGSGVLTYTGYATPGWGTGTYCINLTGSGSAVLNGTFAGAQGGSTNTEAVRNSSAAASITINGSVTGAVGWGVNNASTGIITVNGSITAGASQAGANNASTGTFIVTGGGNITAVNGVPGFTSSNVNASNRLSCSFISSPNGTAAVYALKYVASANLSTAPANAKTRYALNGISTYVDFFTADNSLTQANPTDVRTGVSYASGALTGTLTVPSEGTVSNGVTVGPLMPFTATRSSTTATATLAYSYPYTAGDKIVVTGASNAEWNGTYTIASVISGTSITFAVPVTYSSTAGTGAQMQTVGTGILTADSVRAALGLASANLDTQLSVLSNLDAAVSSRLAPSGTLATVTTLTNAPASVTPAQIRQEMDSNSTKLANLDATVSSRLATSAYTAPSNSDVAAIKAKTDLLNTDRLAQASTVATTGAQIAAALS